MRLLRRFRFGLMTLFVATLVAAFVAAASLPFQPEVRFSKPNRVENRDLPGAPRVAYLFEVKNVGRQGIWCQTGQTRRIKNYEVIWSPKREAPHVVKHWSSSGDWEYWAAGESRFLELISDVTHTEVKICVTLNDWRGRETIVQSQVFNLPIP